MIAQNRYVFDKLQLAFWQFMVQTLTRFRSGIYWIKGHFLGLTAILIGGIMLTVITSTIAYGQIINFPFLDLMAKKNQPLGNYMVILYDDLSSSQPKYQTAWMVFQTEQPQPMKMLKLIDSSDLVSLLSNMNPSINQTLPLDVSSWLSEQGVDIKDYVIVDFKGLSAIFNAMNRNDKGLEIVHDGTDRIEVLNLWCSVQKDFIGQPKWEYINQAISEKHILYNNYAILDMVFPNGDNHAQDFSTTIYQVIY